MEGWRTPWIHPHWQSEADFVLPVLGVAKDRRENRRLSGQACNAAILFRKSSGTGTTFCC